MKAIPEHELIQRCRQGDEAAFRELVDRYKGLVFSLVSRSLADRTRAEDVAQDVFLKVHKGLPYFRGEARLSTWIYRIVLNAIAEQRREVPMLPIEGARGEPAPALPAVHDRALGDLILKDRLAKAVLRLPPAYQLLVNGHYLEGMRYEDLADALDMPLGTVKTHLHRAKRQLRQLLETEFR